MICLYKAPGTDMCGRQKCTVNTCGINANWIIEKFFSCFPLKLNSFEFSHLYLIQVRSRAPSRPSLKQ